MSYFYDLEKPGTFGIPNRILQDAGTEFFKMNETGTNGMLYYPSTAVWHIIETC